jgi:hypothetical protein
MTELTQERLKELFDYDKITGVFVRIKSVSNTKVGDVVKKKDSHGHLQVRIDGKQYSAHRLVWLFLFGKWPSGQIDHINGVRSDNRLENLRDVNATINAQNIHNARSDSKTKLLGAAFHKASGKYVAQISVDKKIKHLGLFSTPEEAHQQYLAAKRNLHVGCTI